MSTPSFDALKKFFETAEVARKATRPLDPPAPEHHHLPSWVRRLHAQARPILADLLGNLSGDSLQRFQGTVDALITAISSGKFSQAWQYPRVIGEGMEVFESHRRDNAEQLRAQRFLEQRRKKAGDSLREAGKVMVVPHAGHLPNVDNPEFFNHALTEFIALQRSS